MSKKRFHESPTHFEYAFERFEKEASLEKRKIKTFNELLASFAVWGKNKAPLTRKQTRAIAIEANKKGITDIKITERSYQKGKIKDVTRNPISGEFTTKSEMKVIRGKGEKAQIKFERDNYNIYKYSNGKTVYKDKKGKFIKKPTED